ncbi:MAG: RNA-directed DNA polymerase, partial [Alphaproteobacteria bacterium]|nr:RNA-directed DNA polymerase [Alphaproteobacteria bacterium]
NPQEPVSLYFRGDDLFTPYLRRRGLPIGNLTSQLFANVYLDPLDHFVKEVLRAKGYLRYVDDFALFHDDAGVLEEWRRRLDAFLTGRRLKLHPVKTMIRPTAEPTSFLGFELLPDGRRRLPEDNVCRFRGRLRGLRDAYSAGTVDLNEVERRVGAWIAHAEHADTWRLRHAIFRGGIFDPARSPSFRDGQKSPKRKSGRPPKAAVFCAAAPGTTTRGICARRTATGTKPTTATTT